MAQARGLLSDLRAALEDAPEQLAKANQYFLGSMVLIKKEGRPMPRCSMVSSA